MIYVVDGMLVSYGPVQDESKGYTEGQKWAQVFKIDRREEIQETTETWRTMKKDGGKVEVLYL